MIRKLEGKRESTINVNKKVRVLDRDVMLFRVHEEHVVSITDIAEYKTPEAPAAIIKNWLRGKNTIELLGLWERIHNPDVKLVEFNQFGNEAGSNHFVLSPKKWIECTNAIGLLSKSGRYGDTLAHVHFALEFASWISVEFKFYLLKEFQRFKEAEVFEPDWSAKRILTKINYRIHTYAMKENLTPPELTKQQINFVYASEADLANLESLNAHVIEQGPSQARRLQLLHNTASTQMKLLIENRTINKDRRKNGRGE